MPKSGIRLIAALLKQLTGGLAQHAKGGAYRTVILPPLAAEDQMASLTMGQRKLEKAFQHLELVADRRGRDVQLLRGGGDAAQPGDGLKRPYRAQGRIVRQPAFT